MHHRTLGDILANQELLSLPSSAEVLTAAKQMSERNVAAILVIDDGVLRGIFTERDLLQRVVAAERAPATTKIGDVMTANVVSLDAGRIGFEAVRMMIEQNIRHIAVTGLEGGRFGVVSIRDFPQTELATFEKEMEFEGHLWTSM